MPEPPSLVDRFEEAYTEFARGGVEVLDMLGLGNPNIDTARIAELRQRVHAGDEDAREAADGLQHMFRDAPCSPILDGVVAYGLGDVPNDPRRAAEIRVEALRCGAVWHPGHGSRLLARIARTLGLLGEVDAAERFARRALDLDPVNPIALSVLAEAWARRDEHHGAWSVRQYLVQAGYGPEVHGDLDRVLKPGDPEAPAHRPSLDGLRPSTPAGWARLAVCAEHDTDDFDKPKLRALALGAAAHGQWGVARWYAAESVSWPWHGPAEHTATEEVWSRELAALLAPTAGDEWLDEELQWTRMMDVTDTHDPADLDGMLYFSGPDHRLQAAERSTSDASAQLLAIAAEVEIHTGGCLAPPGEASAASARYRRRRREQAPGGAPRVLPEEGADHPIFAELGRGEACYVWVTANDNWPFMRVPRGGFAAERALDAIERRLGEQWRLGRFTMDSDSCTRQIRFEQVADPPAALRAVLEEFANADVPADEIFIAKVRVPESGFPRPVEDPRRAAAEPAQDADDFWRRSFDPSTRPLPAEREGLSGLFAPSATGPIPQLRTAAPWFDDLTVIGGLVRDAERRSPDARHDEVVDSLRRHLAEHFYGVPPTYLSRTGDHNGRIDPIRYANRNGFAVAVSGLSPEFVVYYPDVFRSREAEMFAALRAVVRECGLAPVAHWSRTGGTWIYNIWER